MGLFFTLFSPAKVRGPLKTQRRTLLHLSPTGGTVESAISESPAPDALRGLEEPPVVQAPTDGLATVAPPLHAVARSRHSPTASRLPRFPRGPAWTRGTPLPASVTPTTAPAARRSNRAAALARQQRSKPAPRSARSPGGRTVVHRSCCCSSGQFSPNICDCSVFL
jgi:hypothetical protein